MTIPASPNAWSKTVDLIGVAADREWAVRKRRQVGAQREQYLIDAEVRETRRRLLRTVRRRGGDAVAFCDDDFLAVADRPTLYRAVLDAAVMIGGADNADLQLYDRRESVLRLVGHHGFSSRFLSFFAAVDAATPTACAAALTTRRPVLVDDITRHEIFTGRPTLEPILDAGSRAVSSYPLITGERLLGVLSFHHRKPGAPAGRAGVVASCAAQALARTA